MRRLKYKGIMLLTGILLHKSVRNGYIYTVSAKGKHIRNQRVMGLTFPRYPLTFTREYYIILS